MTVEIADSIDPVETSVAELGTERRVDRHMKTHITSKIERYSVVTQPRAQAFHCPFPRRSTHALLYSACPPLPHHATHTGQANTKLCGTLLENTG
jgi:hypothetical protein